MDKMTTDITAVLAVLDKLELTSEFLKVFRRDFPEIKLAIGALGCNPATVEFLKEFESQDKNVDIVFGEEGKTYSFSENFNAAINLVKTPKLVLIHNDMVFHKEFFDRLSLELTLSNPKTFKLYTTIEPLKNQGLTRPGKLVADFGEDFSSFKETEFNKFVNRFILDQEFSSISNTPKGYGFFLAGFTESFKDVGGFDFINFRPAFCEDDDFQVRLKIKGYWVEVSGRAVCYHFGSQTSRSAFHRGMTKLEIISNRFFGRKWGFEARFLWKTNYHNCPVLRVRDWRILGVPADPRSVINMEPLVDVLIAPKNFHVEAYINSEARTPEDRKVLQEKIVPDGTGIRKDAVDIIVKQEGPENFAKLSDLLGFLRINGTDIPQGEFVVGPYRVIIQKDSKEVGYRADSKNYLSLIK